MSNSLDRLINLAKQTGDKLIIHDPIEGRDIVILGIDEYENLVLDHQDVRAMSSDQMLDQINRNIAVWRSNREMDERWEQEQAMEDDIIDQMIGEDMSRMPAWHSASDVMEDRYGWVDDGEEDDDSFDVALDSVEEDISDVPKAPWDEIDISWSSEDDDTLRALSELVAGSSSFVGEDDENIEELTVEEIPFEPVLDTEENWEEEALSDEDPVFLEEPV